MRAVLCKLPVSGRGSAFAGAEHSGPRRVQFRVWRERGGQPAMPSARPTRFARRRLCSVRADPASLTRAFAPPRVAQIHCSLCQLGPASLCLARVAGFSHSIVHRCPRIASRCARCRPRAFIGCRAFARTTRRATNEQHGASRAHGPDAQYYQPLFHFSQSSKTPYRFYVRALRPRPSMFCITARRSI